MAKLDSPYWNEELGVCEKHNLPELPCPQCLATNDPDLVVIPTAIERSGWVDVDLPTGISKEKVRC